jgi:hypothetical protein
MSPMPVRKSIDTLRAPAGNAMTQLTDEARKGSFERVRERLFGVTVVTYDELFGRVAGLISLLERFEEKTPT